MLSIPMSPLHPYPHIYLLSVELYGVGYPFGQPGSAVLAVSPPVACAPPAPTSRQNREQKCPWLCESAAQQQLTCQCASYTVFSTNPK